ncbi:histidine phosphatase family protein [Streptomyces europaeiscabiei]|uniref:histidine phosphatase family protein n=1 Tax=Streptomyces europaeiscabiei TaxID=146819 RepID=UPI0006285688|nr:histidine phosphatase family protein [Streptomyces europaeiscabiei]MDX3840763.1 histidine phosphatase family protein [Streptomyces europaeiscabiei]MDX3864797.1 histidine phosphatase family protein [Streptomyces europaeiscabiei]MDX3871023.1 histidine phosphatase family protein [Streptomyces europaeiscabiei]
MREFIVEADGGSRGNPGPAGYGSVVLDAVTGETLVEAAEYIGVATNNVAEYRGLIAGLKAAYELDPEASVRVRMDSKLVVEQLSGRWKIKHPDMKPLAAEAARVFPPGRVTYEWMPREQNKHADRLANEAMDAGKRGERWSPSASTAELDARAGGTAKAVPSEPSGPPGDATAGAARARAALAGARGETKAKGHAATSPPASAVEAAPDPRLLPDVPDVPGDASAASAGLPGDAEVPAAPPGVGEVPAASPGAAENPAASPGAADAVRASPFSAAHPRDATSSTGSSAAPAGSSAAPAGSAGAPAVSSSAPAASSAAPVPTPADRAAERGGGTRSAKAAADSRAARNVASTAPDLGTPATFVLLRHGETPLTPQKRFSGSGGSDPSLSDIGRYQAERVAAALAARGTIQEIVSSPLARCRETAGIVAARLGLGVTVEDGLRETDFGAWEGLSFGEVRERYADDMTAWLTSPDAEPTGGGESFEAVGHRVAATRDELVAAHRGRTVLLVSHVTPIKTLVRLALGAPPESLFRMELSAASLSALAYYADGNATLRLLNDTSHLR